MFDCNIYVKKVVSSICVFYPVRLRGLLLMPYLLSGGFHTILAPFLTPFPVLFVFPLPLFEIPQKSVFN